MIELTMTRRTDTPVGQAVPAVGVPTTSRTGCHLSTRSAERCSPKRTGYHASPKLRHTRTPGFTLLEILIATIISAFVALTALASLQAVTKSRDKIDTSINVAAELNFAARMIANDLRNVARTSGSANLIGIAPPIEDVPAAHLIVQTVNRAKARPGLPENDIYEVEYFIRTNEEEEEEEEEQSQLMRRIWPNPNRDDEPAGIMSCIAENITEFRFAYYDGQEWLTEWPESMTELPHLVELTLSAHYPHRKNTLRCSILVSFPRRPGPAIAPSPDIGAGNDEQESQQDTGPDQEERE